MKRNELGYVLDRFGKRQHREFACNELENLVNESYDMRDRIDRLADMLKTSMNLGDNPQDLADANATCDCINADERTALHIHSLLMIACASLEEIVECYDK